MLKTKTVKANKKANEMDVYNIFMQAPVAICIFRGENYILEFANDFYLQILGKEKSIIGEPIFESLPELIDEGLKDVIDGVMESGISYTENEREFYIVINNKKTQFFFNCVYQPIKETDGTITGTIVIFTNVTEQVLVKNKNLAFQRSLSINLDKANIAIANQEVEKGKRAVELTLANQELEFQDEEKEKREIANKELEAINYSVKLTSQYARSIIEASLDPLFTISPAGKITDLNQATVKVTGVTRKQLIGTNFFYYFTEPNKAREGYERVFANGYVVDYPLTIMGDKLTDVLFNGSIYKDEKGNIIGAVAVARDITEHKRVANELTEAKVFAELATLIAEEAQGKAEEATRIAKDAVRAKQQFLSNMSHEIRTPMNAIIGFTKVVLKTELTAKQKEYLTAIKMSGDALIVLINDILDLAKVDAGKMTFEKTPFKLSASIAAMLHLFEPKIEEKNLNFVKEYDSKIPEVLVGDPVRLHQIILNLLSNAVKFTNHGTITVSLNLVSEDKETATVQFVVTDTGIGISESKKDTIFENFQQATSGTSRIYGGTGLGLAIVKQLVESQDGTISVDSKIDEGSSFSFTLKFSKTNAEAQLESEAMEIDTKIKNVKVLVVEDIALNQLLMKTLLDDFGFECDIAANGKIAIDKLQNRTYDIILMDLQMPEMNGFEATEHIRKIMNLKIPIMALTADVTTVDLAKCKDVGMNDYVAKPVDEKLLYSKIISLVKKPNVIQSNAANTPVTLIDEKIKYVDLGYLNNRTKSNSKLMMEMISLYLDQTPTLIATIKNGFANQDWETLKSAVHKMIPSFAIMGMNTDFENMAKRIQEYAHNQQEAEGIHELVSQLEMVCNQSCIELKEAFEKIKNETNENK